VSPTPSSSNACSSDFTTVMGGIADVAATPSVEHDSAASSVTPARGRRVRRGTRRVSGRVATSVVSMCGGAVQEHHRACNATASKLGGLTNRVRGAQHASNAVVSVRLESRACTEEKEPCNPTAD
jgi:hypothetical protein